MKQKIYETSERDINVEYPRSNNPETYIGLYDIGNAEVCENLIKTVDDLFDKKTLDPNLRIDGVEWEGPRPQLMTNTQRQDRAVFINNPEYNEYTKIFSEWLQICIGLYGEKYNVDHNLNSNVNKYHQVEPYENGYSVIHYEAGDGESSSRCITWLMYLNDVNFGGETEFPQQGIRVAPKVGRMVVWPAAYTHPHRGNPPYERKSYVTGWFYGNGP